MATYRVFIHIGPVRNDASDHFLEKLRSYQGPVQASGFCVGTENAYFTLRGASDSTDATILAQDLLVAVFGKGTGLTRAVTVTQLCGLNPNHLGACGP